MPMVRLRGNIKLLYLLLLPFFLFAGNQLVQNKHAHFYSNEIVLHSHPLENNHDLPATNHNHTKAEIHFYQLINFDYYSHSAGPVFKTGTFPAPNIFTTDDEQSPYVVWLYNTDSRDPPAVNS